MILFGILMFLIQSVEREKALSYVYTIPNISAAPAPGKLSWMVFLFTHKNGDSGRFLPGRSPKWRVIHQVSVPWYHTEYLFVLAHCTKRYPIYYERVSYPPMILFSGWPFFSFQIQENNVYKRRYNILFLTLFLSQCFKETFNRIRPCLSNVTCCSYWQVACSCARSWNYWAVIFSHYWSIYWDYAFVHTHTIAKRPLKSVKLP